MKPSNLSFTLTVLFFLSISSITQSSWSFLIYADPATDITEAVFKNVNDLVQSYASSDVNFYVQFKVFLDKDPNRAFAWRYVVHDHALQMIDQVKLTGDDETDLINAIAWAFGQQPTDYYGMILSGHGSGILEPEWNAEKQTWENEPDGSTCVTCRRHAPLANHRHMRSMLLNDFAGTCLTNNMIINVMSFAQELIGQKLNLLGLDMCMGACFEHAYELSPYVNYMVGVQNCASADGFDFYALGQAMQQQNCTPKFLAQDIVKSFGNYYQNLAPQARFTLSAFNLAQTTDLANSIDLLAQFFIKLLNTYPDVKNSIMIARQKSFHACIAPMYTDLYQLSDNIVAQISDQLSKFDAQMLQLLVTDVQTNINQMVCANITGINIDFVHGINIYFPYSHIDSSYYDVPFAKSSSWLQFLEIMADE